ncbi:MAG: IS3 family transposase, partial [Actinomycetota bacterium]|nr:IS3 family transposase [Actinomycetota bacterium]
MSYRFVRAERANHAVTIMCRVLEISTSGYYDWLGRRPSERSLGDHILLCRIKGIHKASRETYGAPRVHVELREDYGVRCGRKRVARIMRAAGIKGCHRRRRHWLTRRDHNARPAPDLVERKFEASEPDRLWAADITYVPTSSGPLYLAVVFDVFSRAVVGWSMRPDLSTELVTDALETAIRRRRPRPGLIHHSDQGSQYTSLAFGRRLREAGIAASMGSVGDCYDNALAESFFATLECELI